MANELKHTSTATAAGLAMAKTDWEDVDIHQFNSQATGDIMYASSATQLSRLAAGAQNTVLVMGASIPAWSATLAGLTLTSPTINGTIATTGLTLPAVTLGGTVTGGSQILSNLGKVYIGDTSDANVTLGLVVNQGAADNYIASFKSSDVAHHVTAQLEADTYAAFGKANVGGGFKFLGMAAASATVGLKFFGVSDVVDTTKSAAGDGSIQLCGALWNGATNWYDETADANLVVIRTLGTTRFIFDAEGSAHADVEWTTFAKHDDLSLALDMEQELLSREDEAKTARRHLLEDTRIIGRGSWHMENGKPRAMVNFTKLSMLHHGALLQLHERIERQEQEIFRLNDMVKLLSN